MNQEILNMLNVIEGENNIQKHSNNNALKEERQAEFSKHYTDDKMAEYITKIYALLGKLTDKELAEATDLIQKAKY